MGQERRSACVQISFYSAYVTPCSAALQALIGYRSWQSKRSQENKLCPEIGGPSQQDFVFIFFEAFIYLKYTQ
jgi:hypothetical protein